MSGALTPQYPVTRALFLAASTAPLNLAATTPHRCGACGTNTDCVPAKAALSHNFSTWEDIRPDGPSRWLCGPCAWAYKTRPALNTPLVVTAHPTPAATRPQYSVIRSILSRPIPADTSLIVPVAGKRTLAPLARWGMLTFDNGTIPWTKNHATLLAAMTTLRDLGAHERSLPLMSAPSAMLAAHDPHEHPRIRALWRSLDPARQDSVLLGLLARLSRRDTPEGEPA